MAAEGSRSEDARVPEERVSEEEAADAAEGKVGSEAPGTARPSLRERLSALMAEYGPVAFGVYFGLFALTLAGFALAIHFGISTPFASGATAAGPSEAAAGAGTLFLAWGATKLTQPLRIAATLALTPLAARLTRGRRGAA